MTTKFNIDLYLHDCPLYSIKASKIFLAPAPNAAFNYKYYLYTMCMHACMYVMHCIFTVMESPIAATTFIS